MKERENREFWIRQTTTLLTMLSIDIFILSSQGFSGCGRTRTTPDPKRSKGRLCPCPDPTGSDILRRSKMCFCFTKTLARGRSPWTPEEREKKPWRGHGWARRSGGRTVGVRVTEAEAEELQERAQAARLSMGAYLRRRGLGQRVRMAAERRLGAAELRELNRIGVNLNQMARAMNSGAGTPAGTREAVERVGELVVRLLAGEAE